MTRFFLVMSVCLVLACCSLTPEERALRELQRMQAAEFFDDSAQRALANAVERVDVQQARMALEHEEE